MRYIVGRGLARNPQNSFHSFRGTPRAPAVTFAKRIPCGGSKPPPYGFVHSRFVHRGCGTCRLPSLRERVDMPLRGNRGTCDREACHVLAARRGQRPLQVCALPVVRRGLRTVEDARPYRFVRSQFVRFPAERCGYVGLPQGGEGGPRQRWMRMSAHTLWESILPSAYLWVCAILCASRIAAAPRRQPLRGCALLFCASGRLLFRRGEPRHLPSQGKASKHHSFINRRNACYYSKHQK